MARLQKDVVNYFPHDASASSGDTITVLQSRFGNDGYAFWFKLLEKLSSTEGHYLDCRNSTKWQLFLAKTGVNELTGVEIMKLLVEMQAIDKELWESRLIWCQKLVDNVSEVYRNRRREIPRKPIIMDGNIITTDSNALTTGGSTQSKVKESKVNNTNSNIPKWIDKILWGDFLDMRKKKRATPTERAMELLIKELEKLKELGNDPNEVLKQSIMRNWTGVFPLKESYGKRGGHSQEGRTQRYTRPEDIRINE